MPPLVVVGGGVVVRVWAARLEHRVRRVGSNCLCIFKQTAGGWVGWFIYGVSDNISLHFQRDWEVFRLI